MGYPHYADDCNDYHGLVRDFGFGFGGRLHQADWVAQQKTRPRIVCLCGSSRFYKVFQETNYDRTMAGEIVLSIGFYPHAVEESGHGEGVGHDSAEKVKLDELHKRKIDLCDYVMVINVDGYIGESTRSEIDYALALRKPVTYLFSGFQPF